MYKLNYVVFGSDYRHYRQSCTRKTKSLKLKFIYLVNITVFQSDLHYSRQESEDKTFVLAMVFFFLEKKFKTANERK